MTSRVSELKKLGQSLWFDQMERSLITTGELRRMIAEGEVLGLTSNPTIFQKAITGSDAYDDTIQRLAQEGKSAGEINEALVLEDIAAAADLFLPVYEAANGGDGFVSIEVSPELAFDAEATTIDARRLHRALHRKNVLVKVPATKEGLGAIEQLTSEGINVNVTLIFSVERYREVTEAYIRGLERRVAEGLPIDNAASVASFFVSRIDVSTEKRLQKVLDDPARAQQHAAARELFGKTAIANAKLAYEAFKEIFHGIRFAGLHMHIGSQIFALHSFSKAIEVVVAFMQEVRAAAGHEVLDLDVGGGIGIKYGLADEPSTIEQFGKVVVDGIKEECERHGLPVPRILIEPGRAVVANAGITLYSVGVSKEIPGIRTYVAVDGGMSARVG